MGLKYLILCSLFFCSSLFAQAVAPEKSKFNLRYTAEYDARQLITLHGITDKTKTVLVYLTIGAVVYTIDGKMPVLTDGVLHLSMHDVLMLTKTQALLFKALASMNHTELNVLVLDDYVK